MELQDVVNEQIGNLMESVGMWQGYNVCIVCKHVNHYKNGICASRSRESFNEIQADLGPFHCWNGKGSQQARVLYLFRFGNLTNMTLSNLSSNVLFEKWPVQTFVGSYVW
jgi:hypothetical protein